MLFNLCGDPLEAVIKPLPCEGTAALYVPDAVFERGQVEVFRNFCRTHCIWEILFIREHEQPRLPQLLVLDHPVQFLLGDGEPFPVRAVHHEDDDLRVGVVGAPGGANGVLPADVPHYELGVVP